MAIRRSSAADVALAGGNSTEHDPIRKPIGQVLDLLASEQFSDLRYLSDVHGDGHVRNDLK